MSSETGPLQGIRQYDQGLEGDLPCVLRMITAVDTWLDTECGPAYREQPLAQTWARIVKYQKEHGEAIAELILATGQNPRKPADPAARDRLCGELADRMCASFGGIMHLVKDADVAWVFFRNALAKAADRAAKAGYPS